MIKQMAENQNAEAGQKAAGMGNLSFCESRRELEQSLDILEGDDMPLAALLASQLKQDAAKTLNAIGKFVPSDIKIEHSGDNLIGALEQIGAAIDEQVTQAKAAELSRLSDVQTDSQEWQKPKDYFKKREVN